MCGIAGVVHFDGSDVEATSLLRMSEAMEHRGPDDEGYVVIATHGENHLVQHQSLCGAASPPAVQARLRPLRAGLGGFAGSIGLAHRRFSIIDPTDDGHQPFFDSSGRYCVVFNGEIYNYVELRGALEARGARFRTRSDTEVLVESYKVWGSECFTRFDGFWALAIYDFDARSLLLSRDRVGKKPLFYTRQGRRLFFASEIKSLLSLPVVRKVVTSEDVAVARWLAYGRKDVDELTFFAGIKRFPAGSWAGVGEDFPSRMRRYWQPPVERLSERDISVPEAAGKLRALLGDAVRLRMRADVPVALELSGGLDSSALVGLAAEASAAPVTTYTVRFPETEWNEEPFARKVAEHFGVDYRVLDPPVAPFWADVGPFTLLEEEPYHSPNLRTNQMIWAAMRGFGTKVSLNGAAGDELFAGYRHHFSAAQLELLRGGRYAAVRGNLLNHSESSGRARSTLQFLRSYLKDVAYATLPADVLFRLRTRCATDQLVPTRDPGYARTLSALQRIEMLSSQMPYWLTSGDRGAMGVPLEVRAPFLDHRVIEFAMTLPVSFLVRDGWQKWILRKALESILPHDVVWRERKMGFPFPVRTFANASATELNALATGMRNPYLKSLPDVEFGRWWNVVSFALWYEYFINENTSLLTRLAQFNRHEPGSMAGFVPEYLRGQSRAVT